ncbi:hypothetical protein LT234_002408 [Enterococcus faecalis]|uniref:hypothetical protein n=1 Tax=Enterococcus sp. DIV1059_1 TaxID=2774902 RepID=UPI001A015909|nr:hypothetical protein [Enterococcus faecalis]EGO9136037.1 hypothetical protein [Enterococcus faecalis]EIP8269071.1 hypothetical protein [Enterococcus faecalis]ELI6299583.1 hypothetical protein [Enterococcus faecalis]
MERTESIFRLHILPYLGNKKIKDISFDNLESFQILWAFGNKEKKIKTYTKSKKTLSKLESVFQNDN